MYDKLELSDGSVGWTRSVLVLEALLDIVKPSDKLGSTGVTVEVCVGARDPKLPVSSKLALSDACIELVASVPEVCAENTVLPKPSDKLGSLEIVAEATDTEDSRLLLISILALSDIWIELVTPSSEEVCAGPTVLLAPSDTLDSTLLVGSKLVISDICVEPMNPAPEDVGICPIVVLAPSDKLCSVEASVDIKDPRLLAVSRD